MDSLKFKKKKSQTFFSLFFLILVVPGISLIFNNAEQTFIPLPAKNNMNSAAVDFVNSFTEDQKKDLVLDFKDDERFNWDYVPAGREGIPLEELSSSQKELFQKLLESSLSGSGIKKAEGVIILEKVLQDLSGGGSYRDPGKYYITFFGGPGNGKPWGWRYEGHHLSLNFTVVKDSVIISTPMFFGANPAEVKQGVNKGLRVLKNEEDHARELVKSLNKEQLNEALIDEDAPGEILTGNDERIDPLRPKGIQASKLNNEQQKILINLVKEYINNSHPEHAEQKFTDLNKIDFNELYFGWAGEMEKGKPHYYRVQSSTFLIEYDNTQNNANHIHSVWRDFKNDFGEDLLKKHYKEFHQ
jgi:hypothetical protein